MKRWMEMSAYAVCIAASLAGLAVAAWVLISGRPGREGIDAMFLLVVGLAFAVFFGWIPAQALRQRKWKMLARGDAKKEVSHDRPASA